MNKWTIFFLALLTPTAASAQDSANVMDLALRIDTYMNGSAKQLSLPRTAHPVYDVPANPDASFMSRIAANVNRHMSPGQIVFKGYDEIFAIPSSRRGTQVSLISHPMCTSSTQELEEILKKATGLNQEEVRLVQWFETKVNTARDNKGRAKAFTALAGCMAYAESLGNPDTQTSRKRAAELLGDEYGKPYGVKFYFDKWQDDPDSAWNIGLFQFSPAKGGNIVPCRRSWQAQSLPGHDKLAGLGLRGWARFLASSGQSFNAFCGINKIVQTFYVQTQTDNPSITHPDNRRADGTLLPPEDRCVSLNVDGAYAHFGTLLRSHVIGATAPYSNLHKVMSCTRAALAN